MIKQVIENPLADHMPALAEVAYSISEGASAHIMEMLRAMYADPHYAVVREYLSNALDAHKVAKTTTAVEIETPNSFNPNLTIRDYGVGLGRMDSELMFRYGESGHGKRETNEQLGHFGIGGKSGFAIASTITFHAYKGGSECVWVCYLDAKGSGRAKLVKQGESSEADGVKVVIPVATANFVRCAAAVKRAVRGLDCTVIIDGEEVTPLYHTAKEKKVLIVDKTADGWRAWITERSGYEASLNVCIGGFLYKVTPGDIPDAPWFPSAFGEISVDVPIGWLSVTPSRDSLLLDDTTRQRLTALVVYLQHFYSEVLQRYVDRAATPSDAVKRYTRVFNMSNSAGFTDALACTWRGITLDVIGEVRVDDVRGNIPLVGDTTDDMPFVMQYGRSGKKRSSPYRLGRLPSIYAFDNDVTGLCKDVLVLASDEEVVLVSAADGTSMRRVRTAISRSGLQDPETVYIVGPADKLAALTRGPSTPLANFVRATIDVPDVTTPVRKPTKALRQFVPHDTTAYGTGYAPREFWQDIDELPKGCIVAWVPSSACRPQLPHIPEDALKNMRLPTPNHTLAAVVCALHQIDSTFTVITGGDTLPEGAVMFWTALDRLVENAALGKCKGAVSAAYIIASSYRLCLPDSWFSELLFNSGGRTSLLEGTKRGSPLERLVKLFDSLETRPLNWRYKQILRYLLQADGRQARINTGQVKAMIVKLGALLDEVRAYIPIVKIKVDGTTSGEHNAMRAALYALEKSYKKQGKEGTQ